MTRSCLSAILSVVCLCFLLVDDIAAQPSFDFVIDDCNNPVARIISNDLTPGDPGVQGWSMSIAAVGCTITNASTSETVVADLFDDGFEINELVHCPNNLSGAVSAVVLSFLNPVTLDPGDSPHDVLRLNVETSDTAACTLFFLDGCQGSGQPVKNAVTYQGSSFTPTFQELICDNFETIIPMATGGSNVDVDTPPVVSVAPADEPAVGSCSLIR